MDNGITDLVRALYQKNDCVRAIFGFYAKRERDPRNGVTYLKNISKDLDGHFGTEALRAAFLELESCNCGRFHNGRPVKKGYFDWSESPREIAAELVEDGGTVNGRRDQSASNDPLIDVFPFPVRPGITLPIAIRRDMISAELMNLADFVKVIAASRSNATAR